MNCFTYLSWGYFGSGCGSWGSTLKLAIKIEITAASKRKLKNYNEETFPFMNFIRKLMRTQNGKTLRLLLSTIVK